MAIHKEPRRGNLATMVGSSLAVVAAGSLLAFSSLAEQAGLEGLATGKLQPAQPGRVDGGHAITVPAPATAPPGDPRDALVQLVRDSRGPSRIRTLPPVETVAPEPRSRPERPERPEPKTERRRVEDSARVAVAPDRVEDVDEVEHDGPPYGHAYGHYKKKHKAPKPAKKHTPKGGSEAPVYARSANDDRGGSKPPKAPKMHKVEKVKKAKKAPGHSNGKAKGHSKHAHKGKGKGHSKH